MVMVSWRSLPFLVLITFLSSCQTGKKKIEYNDLSLRTALGEGNLAKAALIVKYSDAKNISNETFAQYHLSVCQPYESLKYVTKISNDETKKLFQASIYSLITQDLPLRSKGSIQEMIDENNTGEAYTLNSDEIWRDEWEEIRIKNSCTKYPFVASAELSNDLKRQAKEIFEVLPAKYYKRSIELVGLSQLVNANLTATQEILAFYKSKNITNPYLETLASKTIEESEVKVSLSSIEKNELELKPFVISNRVSVDRFKEIPFLITVNGDELP